MSGDAVFEGTYEEVLSEIWRCGMARARTHMEDEERELEAAHAAVKDGARRVTADGVTYIVTQRT